MSNIFEKSLYKPSLIVYYFFEDFRYIINYLAKMDLSINADYNSNRTVNVVVSPTTGGKFQLEVLKEDTVVQLRRKIARHLQMPGEKLKIVFREK